MTALGIVFAIIAAVVAIGIGWAVIGRKQAQERQRWDWKSPTEADVDDTGDDTWKSIHRLGEDAEERSPRFRNWSPS